MSDFWSGWIIVLTVVSLILITWILVANRTTSNPEGKTTGHNYDGIEEYDNPLPYWWFLMFMITIIFAVAYLIAYPGLGKFPGLLNWTQTGQYEKSITEADEKYGPLFAQHASTPVIELAKDKKAMKMAQRIYSNNCAQCHGSDAKGSFGFPNLTDNDWLYGGSPEQIKTTLINGRSGVMRGWKAAMSADDIANLTAYVVGISGRETDQAAASAGEKNYMTFCVACHGVDGKGNQMFGAPNLTDDIWLYGGSPVWIKQTLLNGRNGKMPAQDHAISSDKIHLLTAYVYSLSNK
jgi:cytochrome c oxidase cbb3-type subunit 3